MQVCCEITVVNTIGERLKLARERLDPPMSQDDVARASGVSQGTIGNIEAGIRKAPRNIVEIAAAVRVNAKWLKSGEGPMEMPPTASISWLEVRPMTDAEALERVMGMLASAKPHISQAVTSLMAEAPKDPAQAGRLLQAIQLLLGADADSSGISNVAQKQQGNGVP